MPAIRSPTSTTTCAIAGCCRWSRLAIVAIVAVPFLLGGGSEEEPPPPAAGGALRVPKASSSDQLTVVQATARACATTASASRAQPPPTPSSSATPRRSWRARSSAAVKNRPTRATAARPVRPNHDHRRRKTLEPGRPTETTTETGGSHRQLRWRRRQPAADASIIFAIDVQIVSTEDQGRRQQGDGRSRRCAKGSAPSTPLPGEKDPVVDLHGHRRQEPQTALLLVSDEVTSVFGEGKCVSGTTAASCSKSNRDSRSPSSTAPNHVRYKINVLKIVPVVGRAHSDPAAVCAQNFSK